jgi:nicotinate-nucleotide adenylyltransferase
MGLKTGILGGTFNPVHHGHVELGLKILNEYSLDRILYILSANPPHKNHGNVVDQDLRWRMLTLALESQKGLVPCDIEMKRRGFSYTIKTIKELKILYPEDEFYFISGSEGFLKIRTWKNYKELLRAVSFIVVLRKEEHRAMIGRLLAEESVPLIAKPSDSGATTGVSVFSYESSRLSISSTLVRGRLMERETVDGLVDENVKKVIEEYRLYGD